PAARTSRRAGRLFSGRALPTPALAGRSRRRCWRRSPRRCAVAANRCTSFFRHNRRAMPERPPQLAHLEFLGDATKFASQIQALIPKCTLLEHFSLAEVSTLAHFMDVYRAETAMEIIRERDGGDFMLMLISGKVEVHKRDRWN